ncbi:TPA: hypothetical protein R0667_000212 [Salmonella enterica subsp. enterica serovar Havana]|nr:hypothetical protein [Salmonella enterica subsp. enterica serovar Havana]
MGQKFFDMHESSRLNMSFKCSGSFNIIYIMRTSTTNERRKQLRRINVTAFLTWCPCDDMDFAQNGLKRFSARFVKFNGGMRPASEFAYHGVADGFACLRPSYARLPPRTPKEKPALQGPELLRLTP